MKNKIKKLKLPLSKMIGNEKDYTAVLLEDVNSNMKAFWEVLSGTQNDVRELKNDVSELKEKSDATWEILQGVKEKGDATFEQVGVMTEKLDSIELRLDSIEDKQDDVKKSDNGNLDKIFELEQRVKVLEVKIV